MPIESHKHFFLGENKQFFPEEEFIVHMAEPRCFIRYSSALAMYADFDTFYSYIAEVQWIDGKPGEDLIERTLITAWNFLAEEERILDNDLESTNSMDDDF